MIYARTPLDSPLTQGDIIDDVPLIYWGMGSNQPSQEFELLSDASVERVIVLTQACDLENAKTLRVQVAVVHETHKLVEEGILKAQTIRDQVRRHRVFGWYFLPEDHDLPEAVVDLHQLHTVPRQLLEQQIAAGQRRLSLSTPYREHLAQHFAVTYSRIALPEPYESSNE